MAITRAPKDYTFGTLSAPAALTDTSISSTVFASLPSTYSTTFVLPLTLHDPAQGIYEVVWVTGHTAGSQTVTVVRGKEGTSAQPWPQNTQVLAAPTAARDALAVMTSTTRPADAHLGMRAIETDTSRVMEFTSSSWHSMVYADATGLGPGHGVTVPNTVVPILKAFTATYSPDANGQGTVNFPGAAFPNGVIAINATVNSTSASTMFVKLVNGSTTTSSTTFLARTLSGTVPTDTVPLDLIVIGF